MYLNLILANLAIIAILSFISPVQSQCYEDWSYHEGKCYKSYTRNWTMTWKQANTFCKTIGGNLAIHQDGLSIVGNLTEFDLTYWVYNEDKCIIFIDGCWQASNCTQVSFGIEEDNCPAIPCILLGYYSE